MGDGNKTAQNMWNECIGEVKDTNTYNCLIILMTWIDEISERLDKIEKGVEL